MCTSWMLIVPVYLTGGLVCKINRGEGEHLNRSISDREVRKLHVAYWTQEKGAKKDKALWMLYSAMLGHSNQRLLSACIYCVNNDKTLKFSTEKQSARASPCTLCHPVNVQYIQYQQRTLFGYVPMGNITSTKSDPFSSSLFVLLIRSLLMTFNFSGGDLCLVIPLVSLS